jgi:uncharacterized protein YjdB
MSLIKCPKCELEYSDSYKECPFCQEDEEYFNTGKSSQPGRRVEKVKAPSIIGPAMLLVVVLLVGFLGYTFLGDNIAELIRGDKKPPVVDLVDPDVKDPVKDPVTPITLTLDQTSLALKAGDTATLTAGGADKVLWSSSDGSVVSVDATGKLTANKEGSATITISAENANSAVCVVTVTPGAKDLVLQAYTGLRDDVSTRLGSEIAMEVINEAAREEYTGAIEWATEDSSVATVDEDGVVTAVGVGHTNITATVNGGTLSCIFRVD